ncbi:MAG TPA: hypothetical protein VJY35_03810 [Candidatus Eisenbacteria bacterium]|nr:hypothetical protein [Candidatus Eisenbacteria bacterium]
MLALAAALGSCGTSRMVSLPDPKLTERTARGDQVSVSGYTTNDGEYHAFPAYLTTRGDSLVLTRPARAGMGSLPSSPQQVVVLPRNKVYSLKMSGGISVGRTVLFGVAVLVALVAITFSSFDPVGNWGNL